MVNINQNVKAPIISTEDYQYNTTVKDMNNDNNIVIE